MQIFHFAEALSTISSFILHLCDLLCHPWQFIFVTTNSRFRWFQAALWTGLNIITPSKQKLWKDSCSSSLIKNSRPTFLGVKTRLCHLNFIFLSLSNENKAAYMEKISERCYLASRASKIMSTAQQNLFLRVEEKRLTQQKFWE